MNRKPLRTFIDESLPGYQTVTKIAGDASFRDYYRVHCDKLSYIVMDAPPTQENTEIFIQVAKAFAQAGLCVPEIIDEDNDNGYLVLSDFGDETLQPLLVKAPMDWLPRCLTLLLKLQTQGGQHLLELPEYGSLILLRELSLFSEWFVLELLDEQLTNAEENLISELNQLMISSALTQPQVWVHRDYHCRNLMRVSENDLGIIDFQDAVLGPVTYDLVSLLKDCYIRYPQKMVSELLGLYYRQLVAKERYFQEEDVFVQSFDYMGLQRHLKVLGLFSRLSLRDGKNNYLKDLPLVFSYVMEVLTQYDELQRYLPLFKRLEVGFKNKMQERGIA